MAISTHHHHHFYPSVSSTTTFKQSKSNTMRVCFSFAAYAKTLINHLITNCNVPVHQGLTEDEFIQIESSLALKFPPDLRSILREGLPVGPGFPNWRSASKQQLQLLINLPILGILKSVREEGFWFNGWGVRPREIDKAVDVAERVLRSAPVLIPVYKSFYISSEPNLAGNPVFEVVGSDVKVAGFDIAGFYERRVEFVRVMAPVWKATEASKVEVWTELAEVERAGSGGWWWCGGDGEIGERLEEAFWRLRDGGWDEDEVMEMMRMDGQDFVKEIDLFEMDGQDGVDGRFEMEAM